MDKQYGKSIKLKIVVCKTKKLINLWLRKYRWYRLLMSVMKEKEF